jgi:hypothetical protein
MSLALRWAVLLLLFPGVFVAQLEHAGCRSYEPTIVDLHGTLIREAFAGPPNFTDIRKGDEAETILASET